MTVQSTGGTLFWNNGIGAPGNIDLPDPLSPHDPISDPPSAPDPWAGPAVRFGSPPPPGPVRYGPDGSLPGSGVGGPSAQDGGSFAIDIEAPSFWMDPDDAWPEGIHETGNWEQVELVDRAQYERSFAKAMGISWPLYQGSVNAARNDMMMNQTGRTWQPTGGLVMGSGGGGYFTLGPSPRFSAWINKPIPGATLPSIRIDQLPIAAQRAIESGAPLIRDADPGTLTSDERAHLAGGHAVFRADDDGFWVYWERADKGGTDPVTGTVTVRSPYASGFVPFAQGSAEADAWFQMIQQYDGSASRDSGWSEGLLEDFLARFQRSPTEFAARPLDNLPPGSTPQSIARSLGESVARFSAEQPDGTRREFGGAVMRDREGRLFYTRAVAGPPVSGRAPATLEIPLRQILNANPNLQLVALWHTHTLGDASQSRADAERHRYISENRFPSASGGYYSFDAWQMSSYQGESISAWQAESNTIETIWYRRTER